jgi:hypothetical protein
MLFLCRDVEAFQSFKGRFAANGNRSGLGVESLLCIRLQRCSYSEPITRSPDEDEIGGCSQRYFVHLLSSGVQ